MTAVESAYFLKAGVAGMRWSFVEVVLEQATMASPNSLTPVNTIVGAEDRRHLPKASVTGTQNMRQFGVVSDPGHKNFRSDIVEKKLHR